MSQSGKKVHPQTKVDKRRETRVCNAKVFSTLVSWLKENKSCMRVDES